MTTTVEHTQTLVSVVCTCGIAYAIPDVLNEQLLDNRGPGGKSAYCPLGHIWHYSGRSDAEIERDKNARLTARLDQARAERDQTQRSLNAQKAAATRLRRRVEKGVCPHCKRHFANVERHMQTQHAAVCGT